MSSWALSSFHFYLPAMAANLFLYLVWALFGRETVLPADFGFRWADRRILGNGRGLSGLPASMVVAGAVGSFQGRPEEGLVLGIGVSLGTILNSLVKRRLGMPQGAPWLPWDHLDFVLGASLAYVLVFPLSAATLLGGLLLVGPTHLFVGAALRPLMDPPELS